MRPSRGNASSNSFVVARATRGREKSWAAARATSCCTRCAPMRLRKLVRHTSLSNQLSSDVYFRKRRALIASTLFGEVRLIDVELEMNGRPSGGRMMESNLNFCPPDAPAGANAPPPPPPDAAQRQQPMEVEVEGFAMMTFERAADKRWLPPARQVETL